MGWGVITFFVFFIFHRFVEGFPDIDMSNL